MRIKEVKASSTTPANVFSMLFANLRLHGRPSRDGCQSALWDCFGHAFSTWRQIRPLKQSHNALWQPSRPGPVRNLKVANTQLANSPWHRWKGWRALISVNLLSFLFFFSVKVMPQSQKGRKIEHVSGERNVTKFNSWWGKEEAVLIFKKKNIFKTCNSAFLNMTLLKKKLNFNWRPDQ